MQHNTICQILSSLSSGISVFSSMTCVESLHLCGGVYGLDLANPHIANVDVKWRNSIIINSVSNKRPQLVLNLTQTAKWAQTSATPIPEKSLAST